MYLEETCAIYLLVRPWTRRELRLENVSLWWRTCVVYLIVRPSVGRGSRLDGVSCFWSNYRFLLTCKVLGGARATTRKCFWWRTCVVYLIVRPSAGRGLRLDDVSCILVGQLAFFTRGRCLAWYLHLPQQLKDQSDRCYEYSKLRAVQRQPLLQALEVSAALPVEVLCRAAPHLGPRGLPVCARCFCGTARSSLCCLASARVFAPRGS